MNTHVMIVLGLSGVGKTTFCKEFIRRYPQYMHLSASQMLREATGRMGEELRTSSAAKIQDRQHLLASILAEKQLGQESRPIIIDAHSVVDNDKALVPVPVSAIAALKPTTLVFCEADPEQLLQRRTSDSRKRPIRTLEELTQQQKTAKTIAKEFSRVLNLPFYSLNISSIDDFNAMIVTAGLPVSTT